MSNFTDFVGGGGSTSYKGSTAVVDYSAVSEGTYHNLNSSGKLVPNTPVISDTGELNQATLAGVNGGTLSRIAGPFVSGQSEGQMPNGNVLYAFSNYIDPSNIGIGFVVLDSSGTQLSYAIPLLSDYYYDSNLYNIESMGQDSTHYIFTVVTKGQNSSNNIAYVRGYILRVAKSDNAITFSANSGLVHQLGSSGILANDLGGSLQLARDKSVYCSIAVTGGFTDTITYELASGTVSASYGQVEQTTTSIPNVRDGKNIQLIKYDDSTANFLLAYNDSVSTTTGYVVKKVLVAADGTHTVTDITPVALSQGTGTTQQQARYIRLYKSEDKSKFLFMSIPSSFEARYQKTSYDGSTLTVGSLQKYSGTTLFRQAASFWNNTRYSNSLIYRYAEDKLYLSPRATHSSWSSYTKGAAWVLGSGDVTTANFVETNLFDTFLRTGGREDILSLISIAFDGIVTDQLIPGNSDYLLGQTSQVFDSSPITQDKIAYVRQSGEIGDTVNISLIEGVTSKDTLSSTYWLNKEGMYYAFNVAETTIPAFSYLKLLSNNSGFLGFATVNAASVGADVLSIKAPEGKYIIVYGYDSTAGNTSASSTGVRVDGNSITTRVNASDNTAAYTNQAARITSNNTPLICKSFSFYRSSASVEDSSSTVYYYIGEPA